MSDKMEGFKEFYSAESFGIGGVGVKLFLRLPEDFVFPEAESDKVKNIIYKLCQELQNTVGRLDPKEVAACEKEAADILALFGDEKIFAEKIPNEYWASSGRSWFIVTTKIGRIKIGWRKRVIVIDWSDSTNKCRAVDLFGSEDVTKDTHMIHAWGYEKAKQYLKVLLAS